MNPHFRFPAVQEQLNMKTVGAFPANVKAELMREVGKVLEGFFSLGSPWGSPQ